MTNAIDAAPQEVATQIALAIQDDQRLTQAQIQHLRLSLLNRHVQLCGLKRRVSSEEILEAYYRCILTDLLAESLFPHHDRDPKLHKCVPSGGPTGLRLVGTQPRRY